MRMMSTRAFAMFTLLWWPATLFGQDVNTLSAQESAQGWHLLFDGITLAGWHVSAPPQGGGRTGPAQPPQPGQVGLPNPVSLREQNPGATDSNREITKKIGRAACRERV